MKIFLFQMNPTVGNLEGNAKKIIEGIAHAKERSADIFLCPELALTGYPPEDLLLLPHFIDAVEEKLQELVAACQGISAIIGTIRRTPSQAEKPLYNSAAVIVDGLLIGFQDKALLPTYDVFDERRYFEPATETKIWTFCNKKVAITICEDIWQHSGFVTATSYRFDPILMAKEKKIDLLLNLSASPYSFQKTERRIAVCAVVVKSLKCPLLLCNQVGGNGSLIFDGYSLHMGSEGALHGYAQGFVEEELLIEPFAETKPIAFSNDPYEDLYHALVLGLSDYCAKSQFNCACLGLSGGIDSALVACIAADALSKEKVLGIMMPSRYSSKESVSDAKEFANNLGIATQLIPIEKPFQDYLDLLAPLFAERACDVTEENIQARIRGILLMAISNKLGHLLLATGNKSELAMGYATLYGDMCGGLGIISDLTKGQVYGLAYWLNKSRKRELIPTAILTKPPSAELRPNQKDSDSLPPYEIIDTVLQAYVAEHLPPRQIAEKYRYPLPLVLDIVRKIHNNEYKRRQSAPGLRISEKAFSVGYHFPLVQRWSPNPYTQV